MDAEQQTYVSALKNYIFVRTTLAALRQLKADRQQYATLRYIMQPTGDGVSEIAHVPDKQMEDFIRVIAHANEQVVMIENMAFACKPGQRVRIRRGAFEGVEGTVKSIKKHLCVVIPVRDIMAVAILNVPKKDIEVVECSPVTAVKTFLGWLGFENVIDKDAALKDGEIKEEDLYFEYEGYYVFMEVKGINGTSTDAECSQIDKIVNRRMRALSTTNVHGIYVVNHQRNIEPLKRQMPPFNDNQIKDAENQSRTLVYTTQLFSLFSDIESGYLTKEQACKALMQKGLADFHRHLTILGKPYNYFQDDTVICLDLNNTLIQVDDTLFYKDSLQRLVSLKVESIQQESQNMDSVTSGKTRIKVDKAVPEVKRF